MEKIVWSDEYGIGVGVIDYQHRKLIRLIGDLQEYQNKTEFHDDVIDLILEELCEYTQYHFTTEEKLMKQISYISLDEHITKHKHFVKKINSLKDDFQARKPEAVQNLAVFLKQWLLNHIAKEDTQIKQYITTGGGLV